MASFSSPNYGVQSAISAAQGVGSVDSSQSQPVDVYQQVDKCINSDKGFSDLAQLLDVSHHDGMTASGLQDSDYPRLGDGPGVSSPLPELSLLRQQPLPSELIEQSRHMQCRCSMGLFTEITRAWLVIDSNIYIWNYDTGEDLAYFDGLNETIMCAGLVRPKAGIFQPHISHLLVLCTPVEFVLLGVTFIVPNPEGVDGQAKAGEMHLLPDPLYTLASDSTQVQDVVGTESGRIFLAGSDAFLFEIVYQAEDTWFAPRCKKINHTQSLVAYFTPTWFAKEESTIVQLCVDNCRNLLYSRSECGLLKAYYMGSKGEELNYLGCFSVAEFMRSSRRPLKTVDKANFSSLVSMSTVATVESDKIHLVAVTTTGVRLYFTTRRLHDNVSSVPSLFSLVHMRLPPGFSPNTSVKPKEVHKALYSKGCTLMASSLSDGTDQLWTLSGDSFPFQHKIMESQMLVPIAGHTWALSEVPISPAVWSPNPSLSTMTVSPGSMGPQHQQASGPSSHPPLVVTQHMEDTRHMVVLSAQGSYIFTKLRPVDQLRTLLLKPNGCENAEVHAFFKSHFETAQACATAVILACSQDATVTELATRALFMFGGEPVLTGSAAASLSAPTNIGMYSPIAGDYASTAPQASASGFPAHQIPSAQMMSTPYPSSSSASRPSVVPSQAPPFGTPQPLLGPSTGSAHSMRQTTPPSGSAVEVTFSARHNGIYMYLSRLIGPLWDSKLACQLTFSPKPASGPPTAFASRVPSNVLPWFLEQLGNLKAFFRKHLVGTVSAMKAQDGFVRGDRTTNQSYRLDDPSQRKCEAEAQLMEKQSLESASLLLDQIVEALGLWKIICEHDFNAIASMLPEEHKTRLVQTATLKLLVKTGEGRELCAGLIASLLRQYIGDNASTSAISDSLRLVCPSMYSVESAIVTKADELIQQCLVKKISDLERRNLLNGAEELYQSVGGSIDVGTACEKLMSAQHYEGVVRLCQSAAAARDPTGAALHYYQRGQLSEDTQGVACYTARLECYSGVVRMMDVLLDQSMGKMGLPSGAATGINPPQASTETNNNLVSLTKDQAEAQLDQALALCIRSEDQLLHTTLFQWLTERQQVDRLLSSGSSHLEQWLLVRAKDAFASSGDTLEAVDMLWKYYEKVKNGISAAQFLHQLAERKGTRLNLQQRLEYLSRAILNAKSCTFRIGTSDGNFLHELEEKMEVARVQLYVLNTLVAKGNMPELEEPRQRLNAELMNITTLYGEFANAYGLSECKLAIIHCAGHFDASLVNQLWKEIIDQEFVGAGAPVNKEAIKGAIVALAQKYGSNNRYFPLEYLIRDLEMRGCVHSIRDHWVVNTLRAAGVSLVRLLTTYDRLYSTKDSCWKDAGHPRHLLFSINYILEIFVNSPTVVPSADRPRFINNCQDSVAGYLVELQGDVSNNASIHDLIANFKDVRARLERL